MGFLHRTHFRVSVMKYLLNVPYQALDGAEVSLKHLCWQAALTGRIAHFQVSMETLCITLCPTVITEGALHSSYLAIEIFLILFVFYFECESTCTTLHLPAHPNLPYPYIHIEDRYVHVYSDHDSQIPQIYDHISGTLWQ